MIVFIRIGSKRASMVGRTDTLPFVSIIIAARNEEDKIERCLEGLSKIDYPSDRNEILFINDQSSDRTGEIIQSWQEKIPTLRYMETKGLIYNLFGKANAIAQAIDESKGEIILTSDADCVVPPTWVKDIVKLYEPEIGCVCGFTLLRHHSIFAGMQSLDWTYLLTVASAGVGWGYPLSAVGNNMSFRRKAYDDVGGYLAVGFSVTEDFALFKAIASKTKWKVRYPIEKNLLVWSEPCPNWRELYLQKKRWGRGGVKIHILGYFIMTIGFLMSVGIVTAPFFISFIWIWFSAFALKLFGDWLLLHNPLHKLGQKNLLRYFFPFELYYIVYVILLPFIIVLTGRVVWKDRKL